MDRLKNKVALVTGAASGLGRSIAVLFAAEGARVLAADRQEAPLEQLSDEITAAGGVVHTVRADMAVPGDVEEMVNAATEKFGTLDILVNNAGIMDDFSPVGQVTDALWERVMKVNLDGPMRAMRSALAIMLPKRAGVIINIASIGGLYGARAGAAYTTSKHALIGLSRNTGYLYANAGIRCNAIAPGAMATDIAKGTAFEHLPAAAMFQQRIAPGFALNTRTSDPLEVARLALFLASDEASFVNGTAVVADGGWTAY
jgi:NAD(P)-dependent dehydrogenase (short-subunit alcohol dehydrogenase family)